MKKNFFLSLSLVTLTISGCTNDSESDLTDTTSNPETVHYVSSIKAIIDTNCISCHGAVPSNGASNSLSTYENVKDAVLNKGLIDRISRADGSSGAMPLGGPKLPQSTVNLVIKWKNDGLLE